MGVIPRLHGDINRLNKRYLSVSSSMRRRLINDYEYADSLAETLGIKLHIPKYRVNIKDEDLFLNQVDTYLYDMEYISDTVIKMFRDMDFYSFKRLNNEYISKSDIELLMKEFLDYFLKDLYDIYLDLIRDDRIIVANLGDNLGEAFFLNSLDSYYLALGTNNKNPLLLFETLVHELVHIYSYMFLKNYRYRGIENLNNGFFGETLSLYSELSLYEFLKSKNIFGSGLEFQRNLIDYYVLCYFKTVKYLSEMSRREDAYMFSDNVGYEIKGNNRLIVDDDLGIFHYPASYSEGNLLDCRYAMSSIEAFKLMEREKNGESPKDLINEYLLSFQDDYQMISFLDNYIDLDYMKNSISERNNGLKNLTLSPRK